MRCAALMDFLLTLHDLNVFGISLAGTGYSGRRQFPRPNRPSSLRATLIDGPAARFARGMLYLRISDLLPDAQERHYQQSSAIALASGFILVVVLSQFL